MPDDAPTQDAATTDTATHEESGDKTFTQQQVNDLLARQKGDVQRRFQDYDDLKEKASRFEEFERSQQSDLERLAAERDALNAKAAALEPENLRLRVALEKGLDPDLIDRLQGATKEELVADADKLLEKFQSSPSTSFDGGPRGEPVAADDMNARLRRALGH